MSDGDEINGSSASKLAQYIEGYCGYAKKNEREASDDALRQHLVQITDTLLIDLSGFADRLEEEGHNKQIEYTRSADRMLTTIQDSLENPTYLEAAFFEAKELDMTRLEQIYARELVMLEEANNLAEDIPALVNSSLDETDLEERFLQIHDYIDSFNQALFEREYLISGDEDM